MEITDIIRTGHISRWGIVRVHRQQSIAEHMYKVAMISEIIAREVVPQWGDDKRNHLIWNALIHDLPEILSGDIPTPAKKKINAGVIDDEFWGNRKGKPKRVDETVEHIIKVADMAEACCFLQIEGVDSKSTKIKHNLWNDMIDYIDKIRDQNISGWERAFKKLQEAMEKLGNGDY